tara:strand:+ start:337 stop:792 length:456 start_codon:yes stop_codon:yes gene_type:complete
MQSNTITFILINLNNIIAMNERTNPVEEQQKINLLVKIKDLTRQIEYNNTANERMQNQINSLKEDIMILEKPKILESDFEIMVKDLADMVSTILDSTADNINDFNPEFEIGYNNEVSISNINLDYDATEDIQRYIEDRFDIIVPDQTQNTN